MSPESRVPSPESEAGQAPLVGVTTARTLAPIPRVEGVPAPEALRWAADTRPGTRDSGLGYYGRAWAKLRRDPLTIAAAVILGLIVLATLLAPVISGSILHTDPEKIMRTPTGRIAVLQPPGPEYVLGTDDLGRDVLTRLLYAGRVSLSIGFLVGLISIVLGTFAGLVAGYFGGRVDDLVNAGVQFVFNIPSLFILILLSVIFRPDVLFLSLIFGFFFWPGTARQVRGVVLSVRNLEYVVAAEALGASHARILVRRSEGVV